MTVRALGTEDDDAGWELGRLAFGAPASPPRRHSERAGFRAYGAFDSGGRLLAKAVDLEHSYWYGGRLLPATGVAGVAVVPEARGTGVLAKAVGALLEGARERGAVVSALFPTTVVPYRRLGWERAGALVWTALPTVSLASVSRPDGVVVRPAEPADVPGLVETYRASAREGAGMLDRSGPLFTSDPQKVLAEFDGVTVAVGPGGRIEGYASWERGSGYDADSTVKVFDLLGRTPAATQALLALLGTWRSVAPTLHLRLADPDPAWVLAGMEQARVLSHQPWMFRLVDVPAALAARGWPEHMTGAVALELQDEAAPWNTGRFRLELAGGKAQVSPGGSGAVALSPGGIAVLFAGAVCPALARRAGMLSGGDEGSDAFLTAAFAGPRPGLLDYF